MRTLTRANAMKPPTPADMEARFDELEQALAPIDAKVDTLARRRDAAIDSLRDADRGALDVSTWWGLEEQRDQATAEIAELMAEREPLARERTRLVGLVGSIRARRVELDRLRDEVAATESLAATIDQVLALLPSIESTIATIKTRSPYIDGREAIERLARELSKWQVPDSYGYRNRVRSRVAYGRDRLAELEGTK